MSTSFGKRIGDLDEITSTADGDDLEVSLAGSAGSRRIQSINLLSYVLLNATGAIRRAIRYRLSEKVSVGDFGADGGGIVDNATAFAAAAAYVNAIAVGKPITLVIPDGLYYYTAGLAFTREITVRGSGTLDYGGTAYAMKMGADGVLVTSEPTNRHFSVEGLGFIGGASMLHGIYFNTMVTQPRVHKCSFYVFGNATGWAIFGQSSNWDMMVTACRWVTDSNSTGNRNFAKANGADINGVVDQGQSRLRIYHCLGTEQGFGAGTFAWLNGVNSEVAFCKIEGFAVCVQIGAYTANGKVVHNYFETTKGTETIQYGDPSGANQGAFINGLIVHSNFANLHNNPPPDYNTTANFLGPASSQTGLQRLRLRDNYITGLSASRELVRMNNSLSQVDNQASGNTGHTILHTVGGAIAIWKGEDERFSPLLIDIDSPAMKYKPYQGGITAAASTTTNIVLSWTTAFSDNFYVPFAQLYGSGDANVVSLTACITSFNATGVTVAVNNPLTSSVFCGLSCLGLKTS